MTRAQSHTADGRPRARGLGIPVEGTPGRWNGLTDVPGLEVGLVTLVHGDGPLARGDGPVRTGVTAILPRGATGAGLPCAAGVHSFNGNGEMTGTLWIDEIGAFSTPITLTNTHSIGSCHRGTIDWLVGRNPALATQWMLPVVAETWDGYLNDINGDHVLPRHAVEALDAASSGPVAEGSVGGGTGMNCYAFKGGTGTSSRVVKHGGTSYTVGCLVQANFGSRRELTVAGVPLGPILRLDNPIEDTDWFEREGGRGNAAGAGSVIVVVATDAPLLPGQCAALARRVPLGLARTTGSHFSGDIFLAFSTANAGAQTSQIPVGPSTEQDYQTLTFLPWGRLDPFYEAVVQAVEEAVLNALVVNMDMVGRDGHRSPALPHTAVVDALRDAGRLRPV